MQNPDSKELLDLLEEKVTAHSIILYNDDFNTFDHVISCLVQICNHEVIQAEQCAWIVHTNGKCIVKTGEYKELEPLCTSLLEKGLSAIIE
jgi:ATP-dependent Clp protease adaptor protein ClpS